ncbi:hypothetical protein [Ruoffia sp. FAM 20858]|uniref:hypothetical protein n=1 Tax=Ruoffia sp. FAM 20858 TaxID=3259516 RepID=UPI0038892D73
MTKSILERLRTGEPSSKTKIERTQDFISNSIGVRISDMKAFLDIYKEVEYKDRKKIADISLWHIDSKIDEIEELANMFEKLKSDEDAEGIDSSLIHLNYKNIYDYDDSIEEINLELLSKTTDK